MWGLLGVVAGALLMAVSYLIDSDAVFLVSSIVMGISGYLFFAR